MLWGPEIRAATEECTFFTASIRRDAADLGSKSIRGLRTGPPMHVLPRS